MTIPYLDVCSGYSALTQAASDLGFDALGYAEIDAFPSALLGHHYGAGRPRYMPDPDAIGLDEKDRKSRIDMAKAIAKLHDSHFGNSVPNFGDFTQIRKDDLGPVQLLSGGTPCQAFSMAGKRLGLDDPRGNLTLEFLALAKRLRIPWLAWENVPGFLSHDGGRTMGTFLRLLGELGYGWAYRVLDVQYIRVDRFERAIPQRRKRIILVAHLGDSAGPAAVLFDRESLRGDSAPRRESGERAASTISARTKGGGGLGTDFDLDGGLIPFDTTQITSKANGSNPQDGDPCHPLARAGHAPAIAFGGGNCAGPIDVATTTTTTSQRLDFDSETFIATVAGTLPAGGNATGGDRQPGMNQETADTMLIANPIAFAHQAGGTQTTLGFDPSSGTCMSLSVGQTPALVDNWAVRRLTPTECERLMGVPDGFTNIMFRGKPAADGPRYKALGNSQGGNFMRWIAHGIADVMKIQGDA